MYKIYWVMKDTEGNEVEPLGYYSDNEIRMMIWKHLYKDDEYKIVKQVASWPNEIIVEKKKKS